MIDKNPKNSMFEFMDNANILHSVFKIFSVKQNASAVIEFNIRDIIIAENIFVIDVILQIFVMEQNRLIILFHSVTAFYAPLGRQVHLLLMSFVRVPNSSCWIFDFSAFAAIRGHVTYYGFDDIKSNHPRTSVGVLEWYIERQRLHITVHPH